jgi:hypothetical protein
VVGYEMLGGGYGTNDIKMFQSGWFMLTLRMNIMLQV